MTATTVQEGWRVYHVVGDAVATNGVTYATIDEAQTVATVLDALLADLSDFYPARSELVVIPAHTCPRCGGGVPNDVDRGRYIGALSRRFDGVEVCSDCGTAEAFYDFFGTDFGMAPAWSVVVLAGGGQS